MSTNSKETRARAALAKHPKSKAIALFYYLKDDIGLLHNPATADLREAFAGALEEVKGRNAPAIVNICRDCVGNHFDGNCRELIRKCECTHCFLFNVRPYQLKPKVSPKNASPQAFLEGNVSWVIGYPTPTKESLEKPPYSTYHPIILVEVA